MEEKWKELGKCNDFNVLRKHCTNEELDSFEEELNRYLYEMTIEEVQENGYPLIACWYEGMQSTEDFLELCKDL